MNNNKIIDDLARNPFLMSLSKEQYEMMSKDDDFKGTIFDFRDKLSSSNYSKNQIDYLIKRENQTELQKEFNELGGFVFSIYIKMDKLFSNEILSQDDKAKIMLLATYMDYTGKLRFKNHLPIKRNHLSMLLRVNETNTKIFLKKVKDLNLILINDNKEINISPSIFFKGETKNIEQIKDKDFSYTRVFINSYQYLYDNIPKSKLKYLGVIYNLLGYINFHHNVLVTSNPEEYDMDNIIPMTFEELCVICGYKENMSRQAQSRIKNALLDINLQNGEPLFAIATTNKLCKIFINPYVTYASSNIDTWNNTLEIIFKNKKIKSK